MSSAKAAEPDPIGDFERECERQGVTPEEVFEHVGMHRATWYRWRGKQREPRLGSYLTAWNGIPEAKAAKAKRERMMQRAAAKLGA